MLLQLVLHVLRLRARDDGHERQEEANEVFVLLWCQLGPVTRCWPSLDDDLESQPG